MQNDEEAYYSTTAPGCGFRRPRQKSDWAGVGIGDGFKNNEDYFIRLQGQRLFYQSVRLLQKLVAGEAGIQVEDSFETAVRPQLSPCYTTYPATLAAYAAMGLTAFLEFEARISLRLLFTHLEKYLDNPVEHDQVEVNAEVYERMARIVCGIVQNRLLLEDLSRVPGLFAIEVYRLFAAAHLKTIQSVPDILRAVILYGDIMPEGTMTELHPLTQAVLGQVAAVSAPFLARLPTTARPKLVRLGAEWVRAVCRSLVPYLPPAASTSSNVQTPPTMPPEPLSAPPASTGAETAAAAPIPPMTQPHPPTLFDPNNFRDVISALVNLDESFLQNLEEEELEKVIDFIKTIDEVGAQSENWQDLRYDLLELTLRDGFTEGPIQGLPVSGHQVSLPLGDNEQATGEIFEQPVELNDDLAARDKLLYEASPITEILRRNLYPSVDQVVQTQRFRGSGALDPSRLPLADFAAAVFQRHIIEELADPRGHPVVVIACDGSASLSDAQIRLAKLLAVSWLEATVRTGIQVLAALYHSGWIRPGVTGPLIQWLYHPHKTPAWHRREAIRALASLPDEGTGAQSDALSLAFILEEARKLARGRMIYFVLISDCAWNQSFHTPLSGQQEVKAFFRGAQATLSGKLHATLVALGGPRVTGLEKLVDKIIRVTETELTDYVAVAGRIGTYVSSCLQERQRWLARR